jgi:hypothetical protein
MGWPTLERPSTFRNALWLSYTKPMRSDYRTRTVPTRPMAE